MLTGRTLLTEEIIIRRTRELNREVKERKNAALLLAIENTSLEMIVQDQPLSKILDTLTLQIETLIPDTLSSILLLDTSGRHLKHGSAPTLPQAYNDAVDGLEIDLLRDHVERRPTQKKQSL